VPPSAGDPAKPRCEGPRTLLVYGNVCPLSTSPFRPYSECFLPCRRFGHEGTRRRSFFSPMELEWKDATYMAILDTDWMISRGHGVPATVRSAPKSLWDELFARHQQEREELLRWESSTLRRTSSTATLRGVSPIPTALTASESESEMSDASNRRLNASEKGKRNAEVLENHIITGSDGGYDGSASDSEADVDPLNKRWKLSLPASQSPNPFDDEEFSSPGDYDSATSWDALESSSDTMSDSGDSSMYDFMEERA
jgi:hypothetical protein